MYGPGFTLGLGDVIPAGTKGRNAGLLRAGFDYRRLDRFTLQPRGGSAPRTTRD